MPNYKLVGLHKFPKHRRLGPIFRGENELWLSYVDAEVTQVKVTDAFGTFKDPADRCGLCRVTLTKSIFSRSPWRFTDYAIDKDFAHSSHSEHRWGFLHDHMTDSGAVFALESPAALYSTRSDYYHFDFKTLTWSEWQGERRNSAITTAPNAEGERRYRVDPELRELHAAMGSGVAPLSGINLQPGINSKTFATDLFREVCKAAKVQEDDGFVESLWSAPVPGEPELNAMVLRQKTDFFMLALMASAGE